jgi:hypothetical protein
MIVKVRAHITGASKFVLSHNDLDHIFGGSEMDSLIGQSTNLDDGPVIA